MATQVLKHAPLVSRALGFRGFQVLGYVRKTIEAQGFAPTYDEIADELDMTSRIEVCKVVRRLEKRGLLCRVGSERVRRIRLVA